MLANQLTLLRATQAQIVAYERDLAGYLAETPFVLLLSCPAVGVVSAAGYGAELGPIEHYAHPANIRGYFAGQILTSFTPSGSSMCAHALIENGKQKI